MKRLGRMIDLTGNQYGLLTVLGFDKVVESASGSRQYLWRCRCSCGNATSVGGRNLRSGHTRSCGCLATVGVVKHGMFGTPEYQTWVGMLRRCYSVAEPGYQYYGARGIAVCARWKNSFKCFYEDMGPRPSPKHSIDRINNDGDYEPGNCRWATPVEQNNNRRSLRKLTYKGQTLTIAQWSRVTGLKYQTIRARLNSGWTVEQALTEPLQRGTKRFAQDTATVKP